VFAEESFVFLPKSAKVARNILKEQVFICSSLLHSHLFKSPTTKAARQTARQAQSTIY